MESDRQPPPNYDELSPLTIQMSEREKKLQRRQELNSANVKTVTDDIKGVQRLSDISDVDKELERYVKTKRNVPTTSILKADEETAQEKEKKKKEKHGIDVEIQVDVDELQSGAAGDDQKKSKKQSENIKRQMEEEKLASAAFNKRQAPPFIGFFRDGRRRIDFILVLEDDKNVKVQELKTLFLENVVKTGIQLEFEVGMMKQHRHLVFVKVHATDKVLGDYADIYGVKTYFKDKHLEFVKEGQTLFNIFLKFRHEREWIRLVRRNYIEPLRYSNLERSYIVYMVLLHIRYGDPNNYYSLTRLLACKVITDAYALHDGPYFYVPRQNFAQISARQILFYNWTGCENMLTFQPISLIYEYFGPKIGFYFAFYEFYNKALMISVAVAMLFFAFQISFFFRWDSSFTHGGSLESDRACGEGFLNSTNMFVCPKCQDLNVCPFLHIKENCDSYYYKSWFHNRLAWYHSFIICFLVILFKHFWKRTENYWMWIWELGHPPRRHTVRPEYRVQYKSASRSKRTGAWLDRHSFIMAAVRPIVSNLMMTLCGLVAIALTVPWIVSNYFTVQFIIELMKGSRIFKEYVLLAESTVVALVVFLIFEKISRCVAYCATRFENHRIQENFERSYIIKIFGCGFASAFPLLIYTALLKGHFYITPIHNYSPKLNISLPKNKTITFKADFMGDFFISHCGHFMGCIEEVVLIYTLTLVFRVVAMRAPSYVCCLRTDFNRGKKINQNIPSWEREYQLNPITEEQMALKVNALVLQLALLATFGVTNSLTLVLALLVNLWDLRHSARSLLLGHRRPLLHRCLGLGAWNNVLCFICFMSTTIMCLMLVLNTTVGEQFVFSFLYVKSSNKTRDFKMFQPINLTDIVLTKRLSVFNTTHYNNITKAKEYLESYNAANGTSPPNNQCYFEGLFEAAIKHEEQPWPFDWIHLDYEGNQRSTNNHFHKKYYKGMMFLAYMHTVAVVFILVKCYVAPRSKRIKEMMHMERNIIRVHLQNTKVQEKHPVNPTVQ